MKTKFKGILTLFLALAVQIAFAQQTVTGKVTDPTGEPVLGATVLVKGSSTAATTDFDGNYSIQASPEDILQFSFAGYDTQEITVGSQSVINVAFSGGLEELTVIGYRTATPETTNISSKTISSKTIENRPNASIVQTLSGQVAGLNVFTQTGQPGANSTVNIRGIASINGDSEPLFIIDGAFADQDNFRSLNPQDVESVTVLKDAGALAIYGNRGTNGVIIIKTRRGEFNQPLKIGVNSILSYTTLQGNDYDIMSSQQLLNLERERGAGVGGRGFDNSGTPLTDAEIAAAPNTDWRDYFFRTGLTSNQTVSLSSGGKKSTQYTSIGYFDQEGILVQSDLKRFNIRNNFSTQSENEKFKFNSQLSANYSKSNEPNSIGSGAINRNFVLSAYQSVPYLSPDDYTNGADLLAPLLFRNTPLFMIDRLRTYDRFDEEVRILGSIDASYELAKNVTVASVTGIDFINTYLTRAEQSQSFNALLFGGGANPTAGFMQQNSNRTFAFNQTTSLRYDNTFNEKHTLGVGLYTEYLKQHRRNLGFFANGLDPRTFALGDGAGFVDDNPNNDFFVDNINADASNGGLFSYFAAVDYDYDTRFGFGAVLRRDSSYRFIDENKWGTFYSVSGRWNVNREKFMEDVSWVKVLKLRASYGVTGNQDVNGDGFFSPTSLILDTFGTGSGYGGVNSLFPNGFGNPSLQWEEVTQTNIGVDFELLQNGRLRGAVDVYSRRADELFQPNRISGVVGTGGFAQSSNVGTLFNRGVDFDLSYDIIQSLGDRDKLNLSIGGNFNYNRSELQDLPNEDGEIPGIGQNGGQLGEYFIVRYAGVNPANGNALFLDANDNLTETPSQDTDQVWSGKNLVPEFTGGFTMDIDYKGFYLQTLFNFATGLDRFDNNLSIFQNQNNIGQFNVSNDLLRAWQNPGDVTDIPSLDANNLDNASDRYLREADYLRLRFVNIGYNFDRATLEKFKLDRLRVFINSENLFTISKWRGFDASTLSNTSRLYPTPRIISFGVELGL